MLRRNPRFGASDMLEVNLEALMLSRLSKEFES